MSLKSFLLLPILLFLLASRCDCATPRWALFKFSARKLFLNSFLLLPSGQPISDLKEAISELSDCFSKSYDEDAHNCIQKPSHIVVASLMVFTDYKVWLFPDEDNIDDLDLIQLDVVRRRLMPHVRADQCSKKEKPDDSEETVEMG